MKPMEITDSNAFKDKIVRVESEGFDDFECIIDVMEEGGIIAHYWTDEDDSTSIVEKDDDCATLTRVYIPWSSLHYIIFRDDEKYQ
jgi:hypothetical protein